MPQVVAAPPGHTTTSPSWQDVMSQFCVPAVSDGHVTTQSPSQVAWQGPEAQVKLHVLPSPQVQLPFAQVPLHDGLSPSQAT